MSKTTIITDTDCSLPSSVTDSYHIQQVPITINFADRSYTTGVDIDDRLLFDLVRRDNRLPTTSAPAPEAFATAYKNAFAAGSDSVVCITVSSRISATYNAAVIARDMMPEKDITVIDSLNLSLAQGFMATAAAETLAKGATAAGVQSLVEDMNKRVYIFGVLPTLKYLAMSGRVGKLAAGMADTLSIKPILTSRDGKLELLEKIRTQRKANERLLELVRQSVNGRPVERLGLIHCNNLQGAQEMRGEICRVISCPEDVIISDFTPGLSVHTGEGVVGVAVLTAA